MNQDRNNAETSPQSTDSDGSKLPLLSGIDRKTPGFEDGVYDAVVRKAEKLAPDNSADVPAFAAALAGAVIKAREKWDESKGKWPPFAGRAIKWAAIKVKNGVIDPERAYRRVVCKSLDAPASPDNPDSDPLEASVSTGAFGKARELDRDPEDEELEEVVSDWVKSLPGNPPPPYSRFGAIWGPTRPTPRGLCEAFLRGDTLREIEELFGVPRSSVMAELAKLKPLLPANARDLLARRS